VETSWYKPFPKGHPRVNTRRNIQIKEKKEKSSRTHGVHGDAAHAGALRRVEHGGRSGAGRRARRRRVDRRRRRQQAAQSALLLLR